MIHETTIVKAENGWKTAVCTCGWKLEGASTAQWASGQARSHRISESKK